MSVTYVSQYSKDYSCFVCGKDKNNTTDVKILRCARCESAFYCSTDCQTKDWPTHKKVCHRPSCIIVPEYNTLSNKSKTKYESDPRCIFFTSIPSEAPILTEEQEKDAKRLTLIFQQRFDTATCKQIGQQLFDKYKKNGGTEAGKHAVQDIRDWVAFNCENRIVGNRLAENIEQAWDGIGDEDWSWEA